MEKTKLTLTIDKGVLNEYKEFAEDNGLRISARVEKFLVNDLKNRENLKLFLP